MAVAVHEDTGHCQSDLWLLVTRRGAGKVGGDQLLNIFSPSFGYLKLSLDAIHRRGKVAQLRMGEAGRLCWDEPGERRLSATSKRGDQWKVSVRHVGGDSSKLPALSVSIIVALHEHIDEIAEIGRAHV